MNLATLSPPPSHALGPGYNQRRSSRKRGAMKGGIQFSVLKHTSIKECKQFQDNGNSLREYTPSILNKCTLFHCADHLKSC
jgi:hypothetical protein